MKFFFVGNHESVIGDKHKLTELGQVVELDEAEAEVCMRGGCALLTEEEWLSIDISDDECKKFKLPGRRINAPEAFLHKLKQAWHLFSQKHQDLKAKRDQPQA